jgi:hypothetical protein
MSDRYKDLAFAFKDQATHHDININRKLLRILREQDDRITKLEKAQETKR